VYQIGDQIQTNCSTRCYCLTGGVFSCKTEPCSYDGKTCLAIGDPHYETFDGEWHHFQGKCEYVLTTPCNSDNFVISAGNSGQCGDLIACVGLVRIKIPANDLEIVLSQEDFGKITINDKLEVNRGDGIVYESEAVEVVRSGGYPNVLLKAYGVRLFWDGIYRVSITVSKNLLGQLCGLCGTYNNDPNDDLQTPDGVVVTAVEEFGESWLVPDPTTAGCTGGRVRKRNAPQSFNCTTDNNVISEGQTRCSVLRQTPFNECNDVVNVTQYIANCEFDYCCCNETERENCYCDALSSYASACASAGVLISNWRSPTLCCK